MAKRDYYDVLGITKSASKDEVKKKTQNLIQVSMKLGEAVYKSQQKNKPGNNNEKKDKSDDKGKENVVDADFEDVKEDKEKSA